VCVCVSVQAYMKEKKTSMKINKIRRMENQKKKITHRLKPLRVVFINALQIKGENKKKMW